MNPGGLVIVAVGGVLGYFAYEAAKSATSQLGSLGQDVTGGVGAIGSGVVTGADAVGSGVTGAAKGIYHFLQPGTYHPGITTQAPESVNAATHDPVPVGAYVGPSSTALKHQQKVAPKHTGATVKPGYAVAAIPPPGFGASGHATPHKAPKKVTKTPPKVAGLHTEPTKPKTVPKTKTLPAKAKGGGLGLVAI
jgi:hypothetical protein